MRFAENFSIFLKLIRIIASKLYVSPSNTRTEMYAVRVAFFLLVSRVLLRLYKRWDRQTDGWTDARPLRFADR